MSNGRRQDLFDADKASGSDPSGHRAVAEDCDDSSSVDGVSSNGVEYGAGSTLPGESSGSRRETLLTQRLTDILVDQGDGDLLLQRSNQDDHLLQLFQALNTQIMGACRADERLKPLLKMNVSGGVAEDPLLTQLSQHFEPAEVGMLARCFCVPLVSIRVGTIHKDGTRLCPTVNRGNLSLILLPSSDLRLSFIGDDGKVERMFTLTKRSHCAAVVIEEIPEDSSSRSFLIRAADGRTFYFWCSEKSKLLGIELLGKLKDLLKTKPSVADLSGISKSRLDCFATQLRTFLVGSSVGSIHETVDCTSTLSANSMVHNALSTSKYARSRHSGNQAMKGNALYLGSLSPKSSSFKEGTPRNLSSFRIAREKLKRRCDSQQLGLDDLSNESLNSSDTTPSHIDHDKLPEVTKVFPPLSFLGSLGNLTVPSNLSQQAEVPPLASPLFAPHYCWCPPGVSTYPSPVAPSKFPVSSIEPHSLPVDASLFPNAMPASLLTSIPPLNLSTPVEFPPFLPDPLIRMSLPASQQIPTFTPLICDPIVHVPVIDVCSSGFQGYLVSAGPTISSTAISPLHPNLVNPLISESDSVVKGARETLRLLMSGSSQTNKQVMDTLPAVLTNADEKPSIIVAGSRGLYAGTRDVDVIANSIAAMGLASLSGASRAERDSEDCGPCGISEEQVRDFSDATGC
ncbi:hypothetical protein QN277_015798 [Acacia crassicarpa]|uniref:Uncharacterized protein n=1 Tax=Acacia crassicarpa TaxID=499986 RepID=A0AAE1MTR6_9FABA|nr:hypothetical protein QN277_015798 [Acacia crassicarpa]